MERLQIHRVSVADQVAGILRQRIQVGELRSGTALPEVSLSLALGVSRNTLREAVRILALEGLLKRDMSRGVGLEAGRFPPLPRLFPLIRATTGAADVPQPRNVWSSFPYPRTHRPQSQNDA
jgi:DNA-binding FadR family transcriptional regulator